MCPLVGTHCCRSTGMRCRRSAARPYPRPVTICEELAPAPEAAAPDLRIGAPEREAACEALDEHLAEERLDADEHAQRWAACRAARTQSELRRIFLDLPAPGRVTRK